MSGHLIDIESSDEFCHLPLSFKLFCDFQTLIISKCMNSGTTFFMFKGLQNK